MAQPSDAGYFWINLLRALEVEPREARALRGSSGIDHALAAIGIDQARSRLIVVTSESDPRTAAFVQSDLQLAFSQVKVIVARSEMFDRHSVLALGAELREMAPSVDLDKALADSPKLNEVVMSMVKSVRLTTSLEFWNDNGLGNQTMLTYLTLMFSGVLRLVPPDQRSVVFSSIAGFSAEADALVGICRLPIYQLTEDDAELIRSGRDVSAIQDILRRLNTLQYFFPPPDSLALGLIDRAAPTTDMLLTQLQASVERGHPFGQNDLVSASGSLTDIIDALHEKGYMIERERTLEITEPGKVVRETVKYKPRESLISKIINQFSIKLDLKIG